MFSEKYTKVSLSLIISRTIYQKRGTLFNLRNSSSHRNHHFQNCFHSSNSMFSKFFSLTWVSCMYLFHNRLMTSYYFITMYILCFSFILFCISVISAAIQTGAITNIICQFFICLDSHIISTYCLKFENICFILHLKFIYKYDYLFSISHSYTFIC